MSTTSGDSNQQLSLESNGRTQQTQTSGVND
jgi:hypothetical protein